MNKFILTLICAITAALATAQPQFITYGKIEFERKTNVHKQLDNDSWGEQMRKSLPQNKIDYFDLVFNSGKAVYKPGREVVTGVKVPDWISGPAGDNVVFTDLQQQKFTARKAVFENTFLIEDSLRSFDWKITSDTRTIAGFECRKATTIIMDSVFVFAFYTDQIVPAAGPESFNGLPGMILGLAIPRMSTTWFATKLELVTIKDTDLAAPTKGKKGDLNEVSKQIKSTMKNWGNNADKFIWRITI